MKKYNRDEAYELQSSEAHRQYYNNWAKTYEDDFVKKSKYIYPREISRVIKSRLGGQEIQLADIGCGTGLIGVELKDCGWRIDGFDISRGMLNQALLKKAYRHLICLDITKEKDYPKLRYSALISSGTFTFGHLGPDELTKMLILCELNSTCFIGINAEHFALRGFGNVFKELEFSKTIADFEILSLPIYDDKEVPKTKNRADVCIFKFKGF